MKKAKVLVVDDDYYIRKMLTQFLTIRGYSPLTASNGKRALEVLSKQRVDIVLTDVRMPEMDGMQLLKEVKKKYPELDVIVITGYGSVNDAVNAMKNGATDYILKPFSPDEIILKITDIYTRKTGKVRHKKQKKSYHIPVVVAESDVMKGLLNEVDVVAPTDATVLITGETGVGKDVIARLIHTKSNRRDKPFIRMNCVELNEGVIESELFGHEKGSFTGAVSQKRGRLELADGGTLFLDEVGDIPLSTQKKLLRVLEQKEFERVGGTETISIDVRIIAATNKELPIEVKQKHFRRDLYYRLNTVVLHIPPLRERKKDIMPLVEHFLESFSKGEKRVNITDSVKEMLLSYSWPGNVRELKSTIERAVIFSSGGDINLKKLFSERDNIVEQEGIFTIECPSLTIEDVEKSLLLKVLKNTNWNIQQASRILKISRTTLYKKIDKYSLELYKNNSIYKEI